MTSHTGHVPLSSLVLDFSLYPRNDVNHSHLQVMGEAFLAGTRFPPVVADEKSKQVIDGFHRVRTYQRHLERDAHIEVEFRTYADDAARFRDAMTQNSRHGRALTPYDQARCLQRSEELGIGIEVIADALNLRVSKLEDMRIKKLAIAPGTKVGTRKPAMVPIRRTAAHLAGKQLTEKQYEAHKHTTGMPQLVLVNQVINLIEGDLLDQDNEALMARLQHLHELLKELLG